MSEATDDSMWYPNTPCVLGIDEAGRRPVLGPMVYAAAVCPMSRLTDLRALGANNSKALREEHRDELRRKIQGAAFLRTFETILTGSFLSENMLRKEKYNLNLVSHDAAIGLVQKAMDHGINVAEIYIDTVGNLQHYAAKFRKRFSAVEKVVVAKKADATYPIVGAASIVAKTTRDRRIREWGFPEQRRSADFRPGDANIAVEFVGSTESSYLSDPITKTCIEQNCDVLFGFPTFVRFSWGTAKVILEKNAVRFEW
ncbi:Ribonuclease H2 subunit A [Gracilariopsis chorda]|uniref:Ribonuclease n=1 Tax=Gracilariopsis chorda TaxID=448386 RepID=A0A2V3IEU4_9FLOR|nr:Ribonuclease H2 subunit A [Gracilariopsis chorda]|eukprot:PXF40606.1 Ribonuclease H2 subunit A [Gracilariopsis chorda]